VSGTQVQYNEEDELLYTGLHQKEPL